MACWSPIKRYVGVIVKIWMLELKCLKFRVLMYVRILRTVVRTNFVMVLTSYFKTISYISSVNILRRSLSFSSSREFEQNCKKKNSQRTMFCKVTISWLKSTEKKLPVCGYIMSYMTVMALAT